MAENKKRRGRHQGEAKNILAEFIRDRDLSVKQFHEMAEEFVLENCPKLFQYIPGETYLYKFRNGYHDVSKANAVTVSIVAALIGVTPNDIIINPFNVTGKWDDEDESEE